MTKVAFAVITMLAVALAQTLPAAQSTAEIEKRLASAQHKATVDGNLTGAIEDYKQIVASAGANRGLAAQALVRLAACYQQLGDVQARSTYERIVREFPEQTQAVATARLRLNESGAGAAAVVARRHWTTTGYTRSASQAMAEPRPPWSLPSNDILIRDLVKGQVVPITVTTRPGYRGVASPFAGSQTNRVCVCRTRNRL